MNSHEATKVAKSSRSKRKVATLECNYRKKYGIYGTCRLLRSCIPLTRIVSQHQPIL